MQTREEKRVQERARRKAKKIAEQFSLILERDNNWGTYTWWVWGPSVNSPYTIPEDNSDFDLLNPLDYEFLRRDPCEGDHSCCDQQEVLDKCEAYRFDLRLHVRGFDADAFDGCPPGLAWEWLGEDRVNDDAGSVLADWLSDNGKDELEARVRAQLHRIFVRAFPD